MDTQKILELIGTDSNYANKALKALGYTAGDLKAAGYTAGALKALGYTAGDLKALGYTAGALIAARYTAGDLIAAGYTAGDLKAAGYTAGALIAAGYTAGALIAAGYTAGALIALDKEIPLVESLYSKILKSLETDGCRLDQSKWECGSTRCIGGWTEFHGGEAAKNLRLKYGREISYRLIHFKSCGEKVAPPSYNGSTPNEATMAYIDARAKEEVKISKKSKE